MERYRGKAKGRPRGPSEEFKENEFGLGADASLPARRQAVKRCGDEFAVGDVQRAATQQQRNNATTQTPDLLSVPSVHNHDNGSRGVTVSPDSLSHYLLCLLLNMANLQI